MNQLSPLWMPLVVLACVPACRGANTPPLAKFKAKATYFGYQFHGGSSPTGVQIILSDERVGCDELDEASNTISISLSGIEVGDYDISPEGARSHGPGEWSASVIHRPRKVRYALAAGTFTLESLTHEAAENSEVILLGKLHAYAPVSPVQTLECNAGSEQATECVCEDSDGQIATCSPEEGYGDCCPRLAVDHWEVDIDIEAQLCPHLCQATSPGDWETYCGQ